MTEDQPTRRRAEAAIAFNQHEGREDGMRVVGSLADGFNGLCDAVFARVHWDVQRQFGTDSMLLPRSAEAVEEQVRTEIDVFQMVESAEHVRTHRYVRGGDDWFLEWLGRLRLDDRMTAANVAARVADYRAKTPESRPRSFAAVLERTLPEAMRAPLIMYQLLPPAVVIATALAFGDFKSAQDARRRQMNLLSSIGDCLDCHGRLLENGEKCHRCGNPFWNYNWLTAD